MSRHGNFHPLELTTPDGSEAQSPTDRTPSSSTSTAELVSTSAPVDIPMPQNKQEHLSIQMDDMSMSTMPVSDEFEAHDGVFGSFAMTQSLRSNPGSALEAPRSVQRAISTNARMEHQRDAGETGEDGGAESPAVEDPFFPFLSPDLGGDMVASATEVSAVHGESRVGNSGQNKKKRWMIKGLSEADIGNHNHRHHRHHHHSLHHQQQQGQMTSSTVEVQPTVGGRRTASGRLSRQGSRGLRRKSSVSSNLSAFGNYVFGSGVFRSPARSNSGALSERVNVVTDSLGIYPSAVSLSSVEAIVPPSLEDEQQFVPLSSSAGAQVKDLSQGRDARGVRKKGHSRSVSVTSRGSSVSLFARSTSANSREAEDRTSLRDEDEVADKMGEVKPVAGRALPQKKHWQQTMPDLVEGPESETLTVHSTARKSLAAAALAMAKVGERREGTKIPSAPEKDEGEDAEGEGDEAGEDRSVEEIRPSVYKKNLFVICLVFFFSFAAYMSLRNLQSSMNDVGGLGMHSLSCVYAFLCIGSLFTTTIVQRLRPKPSMLIGLSGLLVYNLCNLYPVRATLIPGSCVAGFCLAVMWTSQATYMANNAASYATSTGTRFQDCLSQFHGIFYASFQFSQVVGGAISSVLFSLGPADPPSLGVTPNVTAAIAVENTTSWLVGAVEELVTEGANLFDYSYDLENVSLPLSNVTGALARLPDPDFCGINLCPGSLKAQLPVSITPLMYYIMVGVFIFSTIVGIFVLMAFLDPLEGRMKNPHAGIGTQLSSVFRMLCNLNVVCLLPFMAYTLLQATFVFGEFNKAFVTCYLGIHMIGFMTVCLSICSSVSAFLTGRLQKHIGPEIIIATGILLQLSVLTSYFIWQPSKDKMYLFFFAVAIWGVGDGIVTTLIISLLGILFVDKKEAVFSTYKMTQAASAFILFVTGPYVCTEKKVIALIVVACMALIGYGTLKVRLHMAKSKASQFPQPISDLTIDLPNDTKS